MKLRIKKNCKFKSIFSHILHCRRAPLRSCKLPVFDDYSDDFFFLLRRLYVQNLLVSYTGSNPAAPVLSRALFLCQSLEELAITGFSIQIPSQFEELSNLTTLELLGVAIPGRQLEGLVSGCPNLEKMTLDGCVGLIDLRITAPNLLSLDISVGENERLLFSFIRAPRLKHVALNYILDVIFLWNVIEEMEEEEEEEGDHGEIDEAQNIINLSKNLGNLESLSISCDWNAFKYSSMTITRLPDNLPTGHQFIHLNLLFMKLNLDDVTMVSPMLFLLRSCPNLHKLGLQDDYQDESLPTGSRIETDYWNKQTPPNCLVNQLTTIRLTKISLSSKNVVEFVKFLLMNARVLVRMRLYYGRSFRDPSEEDIVVNEVLLFKRASPQASFEISRMISTLDLYGLDF